MSARAANRLSDLHMLHPDGTVFPLFGAAHKDLGGIVYHYAPAPAVELIVAVCESRFDAIEEFRKWPDEDRRAVIKNMSISCAMLFLLDLPARLADALEVAYEDSLLYAVAAVKAGPARFKGGIVDVTKTINDLVNSQAESRRKRLSSELKRMGRSEIFTPEDDRRLPKITLGRLQLIYKAAKKRKGPDERVLQKDIALKWKPKKISEKQLRRWCKEELGLNSWDEVVRYLEET